PARARSGQGARGCAGRKGEPRRSAGALWRGGRRQRHRREGHRASADEEQSQGRVNADLVIRGGTVLDGSGKEPFVADVAVTDGKIAAVGSLKNFSPREEIDATNLVVSPGFIDIHSHSDYTLLVDPR